MHFQKKKLCFVVVEKKLMSEQISTSLHNDVKKILGDMIVDKLYPWQSECLRMEEVLSGRSNLIIAAGTRFCFFLLF
jgi:hypothetical protein